jgi:hypothetical protein
VAVLGKNRIVSASWNQTLRAKTENSGTKPVVDLEHPDDGVGDLLRAQ